jgi:hypothetical protein
MSSAVVSIDIDDLIRDLEEIIAKQERRAWWHRSPGRIRFCIALPFFIAAILSSALAITLSQTVLANTVILFVIWTFSFVVISGDIIIIIIIIDDICYNAVPR